MQITPPENFSRLDSFPKVDYSFININAYVLKTDFSERRLMYFASYGCPLNCPFCSGAQVFKKSWFPKETDTIINDIKYFIRTARIDSILFWDDNFFSNRKFVLDFANRLIAENINILWEGSAHARSFVQMFSDSDLDLLYRAGLRRVSTGAESGSDVVLSAIKDKLVCEDVLHLIKKLKTHHITTFFSTMMGYPLDVKDDIRATFKLIRKAKLIDNAVKIQINIFTPYPQTPLYKKAISKGFCEPQQLKDWINHAPACFRPPWLNPSFYDTLDAFMNFYLPFSEKKCYLRAPSGFRKTARFFNTVWRPFIIARLRLNLFIFPFDWMLFKKLLNAYNKKHNDNLRFYAYGIFGN
ncbi:MAG: Radical SAM superfamily protein [Bacteroidetes bacterium ADurb.Bin408]|nr:MAG: Radical SAM superfamily protein [Bacteroidetes bacterium ADurb.Bin408]